MNDPTASLNIKHPVYSKLDENNVVINIEVATTEYIASLPNSASYVLSTSADLSKPFGNIGTTYHRDQDVFLHPKPYPSWKLNSLYEWVPPIELPNTEGNYEWDESTLSWKQI